MKKKERVKKKKEKKKNQHPGRVPGCRTERGRYGYYITLRPGPRAARAGDVIGPAPAPEGERLARERGAGVPHPDPSRHPNLGPNLESKFPSRSCSDSNPDPGSGAVAAAAQPT